MLVLLLVALTSGKADPERDWTADMFSEPYSMQDVQRLPEVEGCKFILCPVNGFTVYDSDCSEVPPYPDGYEADKLFILGTGIRVLSIGSFTTWGQILSLRVEMNTALEFIEPRVFFHLSSLTNLSISNNYKLSRLDPDVFDGLTNLRELRFVKNNLKVLFDFTLAARPYILPSLIYLDLSNNPIQNITKMDFVEMEGAPLETLILKMCGISSIEPASFSSLRMLKSLILDGNRLFPSVLSKLMHAFNESFPKLEHLSIATNVLHKNFKDLLHIISNTNIRSLDISDNHFDALSADFFPVMPNLERLDMSGVSATDVEDGTFSRSLLPKLQSLDFSRNRLIGFVEGLRIPELVELNLSGNSCTDCAVSSLFQISDYDLENMKYLKVLDLTGNNLIHVFKHTFSGLESLRALYLSNCTLFSIEDLAFSSLGKLEHLDLSLNSLKSDKLNKLTFEGLISLTSLRLDSCYIMAFPNSDVFSPLTSLQYLTLKDNKIIEFDGNLFLPLKNLLRLDLSQNAILPWSSQVFSNNKKLQTLSVASNHLYKFTFAMMEDFENIPLLNMRNNPIDCNCDLIRTLMSADSSKSRNYFGLNDSTVICFSPRQWSDVQVMEYVELNSINYKCLDWRFFAVIISLCVLFTLIVCSVGIYYLRWYLRYWMFLLKQAWRATFPSKRNTSVNGKYKYDAFVSYSNEDRIFVIRLVAMMENYEPFYRLCVYERDFNAGDVISDSVVDCLEVSRKTILILTDSFARSQWCQWELQMAQHKRFFFKSDGQDSLILVKLGDIMEAHMTPTLRYLMKTRIYLQWYPDPKRQRIFWQKLREALQFSSGEDIQV